MNNSVGFEPPPVQSKRATIPVKLMHHLYPIKMEICAVMRKFIPASNEPSDCLQTFGDYREGQDYDQDQEILKLKSLEFSELLPLHPAGGE